VVKIRIVTMMPYSRVDVYQCLRGYTASIFRGEVRKSRKVADYVEEGGKKRTEPSLFLPCPAKWQ
jgi:hypothetical protein